MVVRNDGCAGRTQVHRHLQKIRYEITPTTFYVT